MHLRRPATRFVGRPRARLGVMVAAGLDQASALDQRFQALGQLPPVFSPQAHLADELLVPRRVVWLAFDVA